MESFKELLDLHKEWLLDNSKGKQLDLSCVDLSCEDFRGADLSKANLANAYLRGANLSNANLSNANLSNADLRDANLTNVDLSNADLTNVDLTKANLCRVNLKKANLTNADLRFCIGNNNEVKSLQIGAYLVSYTKDILNIGCQSHSHSDWKTFSDSTILAMDGLKALKWWNLNKDIIFTLIDREH